MLALAAARPRVRRRTLGEPLLWRDACGQRTTDRDGRHMPSTPKQMLDTDLVDCAIRAAPNVRLLLDYDGTLVPFASDAGSWPVPMPALLRVARRISPRVLDGKCT